MKRFRHVNPPMVLIMDVFEDVSGVRVAQVFDERSLMADGDVDLGPRYGAAEVWNTYALDCADLNLCFGQISPELLISLKDAVAFPELMTRWMRTRFFGISGNLEARGWSVHGHGGHGPTCGKARAQRCEEGLFRHPIRKVKSTRV